MILLSFLAQILNILRSAATPSQIAAGFVMGMVAGLIPSLFVLILVILLFVILNVNVSSGLLAMAIFGFIGYLIDPFSNALGYVVLAQVGFLRPVWIAFYDTPFIPLTGFNNTVVMGNLVLAIILIIPIYSSAQLGVITYHKLYKKKVEQSTVFRYVQGWNIYQWYSKLKQIGDKLW
jgi:uncharacterized protein (TIGR03546 family)